MNRLVKQGGKLASLRCMGCLALVMLALLLGAGPAQAGWYKVTYSGGTATRVASWGTDTYPYYDGTMWDPNGFYSGGLYVGWGTDRAPDGTTVTTTGQVHCQGTITATFTWQPGVPNYPVPVAEDPPPHAVVLKETSSAFWYSNSNLNAVPNGSSSNGLGSGSQDYESPPGADPFWQNHSSSDTRYQIKQNPGASFTITRSPFAHVSGTGDLGPPEGTGSGVAKVNYRASAEPLEVVLSGGIGPKDGKRYLIGQRVGASMSTGGLRADPYSYNWSVSGGEPFSNYTANDYEARFTPLFTPVGTGTTNSIGFYFKKPTQFTGGSALVTCSVHLHVPPGDLPDGGLDVTASRSCVVEKPSNSLTASIGATRGEPELNPARIALGGGLWTMQNGAVVSHGILWAGAVTTPEEYGETGGWNFTQTEVTNRIVGTPGVTHYRSFNDSLVLDNSFGYMPEMPDLYPPDGWENVDGDAPNEPLDSSRTGVQINDSFTTYTMYRPPGDDSVFVPLKNLEWFWSGAASPNAAGVWSVLGTGSGWAFIEDLPDHPEWHEMFIDGEPVGGNIKNSVWSPPL